jgi:dolichol-phosphate mannosyltransferase
MIAYTKAQIGRLLKIDFIRFCIVGGTGFVINLVILVTLHSLLGLPVYIAQFFGAEIALFSNFMLHHHWTYKSHVVEKSIPKLIVQFHASSWPAIIGSTLMVSAGVKLLHFNELLALAVSSAIALGWNFAWSKYIIWRDMSSKDVSKVVK